MKSPLTTTCAEKPVWTGFRMKVRRITRSGWKKRPPDGPELARTSLFAACSRLFANDLEVVT